MAEADTFFLELGQKRSFDMVDYDEDGDYKEPRARKLQRLTDTIMTLETKIEETKNERVNVLTGWVGGISLWP